MAGEFDTNFVRTEGKAIGERIYDVLTDQEPTLEGLRACLYGLMIGVVAAIGTAPPGQRRRLLVAFNEELTMAIGNMLRSIGDGPSPAALH